MTMLEQAAETARALGISEQEALALGFLALGAWADVLNSNKGRAAFRLGAQHAAGQISAETMRQCLDVLDRKPPQKEARHVPKLIDLAAVRASRGITAPADVRPPIQTATAPTPAPQPYDSPADKAKRLRQLLKVTFPAVKFSVTTDTYAGGASIRVRWTDGPTQERIRVIAEEHESIRRDDYGEILGGGNLFVSCTRSYSEAMRDRAREIGQTLDPEHPAFRFADWDGRPNLSVILAELEG